MSGNFAWISGFSRYTTCIDPEVRIEIIICPPPMPPSIETASNQVKLGLAVSTLKVRIQLDNRT